MSDKELAAKIAYFKEQELLDISDDETGFPDAGLQNAERAFADTKAMPPPRLVRQRSSFLGPTPKQSQADFEAQTARLRTIAHNDVHGLIRLVTAPEAETAKSFPSAKRNSDVMPQEAGPRKKLRHTTSLPKLNTTAQFGEEVPFYKRMGIVPREVKNGKNVKRAENIKLEPENKQLLKGKIIYFYPNDDVSVARRARIHKVIKLGAAWVTSWRYDINYIMVDEPHYTYMQVLKHLNQPGLPRNVHLLRFDPYVPECIQFNTLLAPTASRFLVKGGPRPSASIPTATPLATSSSQASLKIKPTRKQLAVQDSQTIDSTPIEADMPVTLQTTPLDSSPVERVLDSFVAPSSDNLAESIDPVEHFSKVQKAYGDALSQAIEQAKATAHLPIDEDEEESSSSRPSSAAGDVGSDTDEERPVSKARRSKTYPFSATLEAKNSNGGVNQLAFQCMNPNSSNGSMSNNPNLRTIQMLEDMCKYYDQMQDQWRTLAYRRGINTLRKQTVKINTKEEAERLPFIGSRLAEKIEEIALTDRLRRLDSTRDDPTDNVLRLFLGVYGAGLSQASKWIQAGYHTLQDLVEKATLTPNQKIGIQHYDDFATRIPRAEVEAHGAFVRTALCKLDPEFRVYVMGSYRRGALDSGDVDLIITKPQSSIATMRNIVFEQLVPLLFNKGFLKASLATSRRHNEGTKWHGASCLPSSSVWRRLDLLLVPEEEMGAALLYFTGNDIFNRSMRLLASKKGMRLNQRGLYKDVMRGKNRERITQGTLVEGRDEKRIFEILGVPWREPEERIC